jgi:hypothetical protein
MVSITKVCTYSVFNPTDAIDDIKKLLDGQWSTNTGGAKPLIDLIENHKRVDLQFGQGKDAILVYALPADIDPLGIGYPYESEFQTVFIDIRTTVSKARLMILKTEVIRIIHKFRYREETWNPHDVLVLKKTTPLSNKTIKLWREIIDVVIQEFANPIVD